MFRTSGIYLFTLLVVLVSLTQSCSSSKPSTRNAQSYSEKKERVTFQKISTRESLVEYASSLKGTNYLYGGTSSKGFDCSGFTSHVLKKFDVAVSRTSRSQALEGKKVKLSQALPGDLVFFSRGSSVFHVALVLSNENNEPRIIHSTTSKGVIVTDLKKSSYWFPKLQSVRNVISG